MTREERLARVEELLEGAKQYLPVLEQIEAEPDTAHDGGTDEAPATGASHAGNASLILFR